MFEGQETNDERAAELVQRYKAGEKEAMEGLYAQYYDPVFSYMMRTLRNREDAHDATQLVFVKTLHGIERYEPRSGTPFRAWLFKIARNVALDIRDSEARRRELLQPPDKIDRMREGPAAEDELSIANLDATDLGFFVKGLPPSMREVVLLRHWFDLSMKQIGEVLGKSPAAAGDMHRRAMEVLERRLGAVRERRARVRRRDPMRRRYKPARVIVSRRFALGRPRASRWGQRF